MKQTNSSIFTTCITLLALAACGSLSGNAATLIGYNFNGLSGASGDGSESSVSANANDSSVYDGSGINGTALTRGSNYGTNVQGNGYFSHNGVGIQPVNNVFTSSVAKADGNGSFLTFSVSPMVGKTLSLTTLNFGGGDQNGLGALGLSYSLNGTDFTTIGTDSGIPSASYTSGSGGYSDPYLASVDLSSITALQKTTDTVTFELSLLNAGAYTTGDFTRNFGGTSSTADDISLVGSTRIIPEPSAWALILCGMGGLFLFRKLGRGAFLR